MISALTSIIVSTINTIIGLRITPKPKAKVGKILFNIFQLVSDIVKTCQRIQKDFEILEDLALGKPFNFAYEPGKPEVATLLISRPDDELVQRHREKIIGYILEQTNLISENLLELSELLNPHKSPLTLDHIGVFDSTLRTKLMACWGSELCYYHSVVSQSIVILEVDRENNKLLFKDIVHPAKLIEIIEELNNSDGDYSFVRSLSEDTSIIDYSNPKDIADLSSKLSEAIELLISTNLQLSVFIKLNCDLGDII